MRRTGFLVGAASAATAATIVPTVCIALSKVPGSRVAVLKAFEDSEGEVYAAYSAQAIVAELSDKWQTFEPEEFTELPSGTILSNQHYDEPICQKSNCKRDDGGNHDCIDVDMRLAEIQRSLDSGEWDKDLYPGQKRSEIVELLWTSYA